VSDEVDDRLDREEADAEQHGRVLDRAVMRWQQRAEAGEPLSSFARKMLAWEAAPEDASMSCEELAAAGVTLVQEAEIVERVDMPTALRRARRELERELMTPCRAVSAPAPRRPTCTARRGRSRRGHARRHASRAGPSDDAGPGEPPAGRGDDGRPS
jgi:hypothetical protein